MTQWNVVLVLISILGLVTAITAPIVKLNTNITKLTVTISSIDEKMRSFDKDNSKSHDRLWRQLEEGKTTVTDHEKRITIIETRVK